MALTTSITARLFPQIGLVGQTPGFTDFSAAQLASDGYISTLNRSYDFDAKTELLAIVDPSLGKEAVVDKIETDVALYLATIFTDPLYDYVAKIYVTNVRRVSDAIVGVAAADSSSAYVDRDDIFYCEVRINVSVELI